ncbi:O-antigen ligase family protein [Pararobbsia silviterrae]|uniref:O-antigen ligase family protein n=1 Tax=Pararobbsia silviterrae TaxID=1792498 RepID=A0A494XX62_9BURK|nr:O-antigen ligase family protein [Pararobbsia silviterrae]RKP53598.1 O-antigen ligase family protein [Pararobbsia silviterrae]
MVARLVADAAAQALTVMAVWSTPRSGPPDAAELQLAREALQARRRRWLMNGVIGLCFVGALVPDTLSMSDIGPAASHTITGGSTVRQLEFGPIFAICAWLIWRHPRDSIQRLRGINLGLVALMIYCLVTALWSPYPVLTVKRAAMFAGIMLTGFALAAPSGSPRQIWRATTGVLTVLLGISCLVAVFWPQVGVDYLLGGAWRGIMWQKNVLGSVAAVASLLWLRECLMPCDSRSVARARAAALLFSLFMLVMADSATSKLVTGISFAIYLATRRKLTDDRTGSILLLVGALLGMYVLLAFYLVAGRLPDIEDVRGFVTGLFNKSSDLTGRDQIWEMVWLSIRQHPIWGGGYGAFWVGDDGPAAYVKQALGWMPPHAHNGYLDILNELGEVGLGLFFVALLWHTVSLIWLYFRDRDEAAFHMALFVSIVISNYSETQLLADTALQNLLFLFSAMSVGTTVALTRQARREASRAAAVAARADSANVGAGASGGAGAGAAVRDSASPASAGSFKV